MVVLAFVNWRRESALLTASLGIALSRWADDFCPENA